MYFITGNKYKFREIKKLLDEEFTMLTIPYPEIQEITLEKVAEFGVEYLKGKVNKRFFIEDSGLFIESLNKFPGVFSAYVFKTIGNQGILKLLRKVRNRKAQFMSVIALYDKKIKLFRGICEGVITETIRGENGFGYDPIFIPHGYNKTYAEMDTEEKNTCSHRGRAATLLKEYFEGKI